MTQDWDRIRGIWPFLEPDTMRPGVGGTVNQANPFAWGPQPPEQQDVNWTAEVPGSEGLLGAIRNTTVVGALGLACGAAARSVREKLTRSAAKVYEGQLASREEGFTDDLADDIDELGQVIASHVAAYAAGSLATGVRVEFKTQKATSGEESRSGLDLGVRMIVSMPDYVLEKAILIQCKRMTGVGVEGTFPQLAGGGEKQAKRMLRTTPAAFFFLFNAGGIEELLELGILFAGPQAARHPHLDPGVTVLPASRVAAISNAKRSRKTRFPVGARDVLAGSIPLGHFIASIFAPCLAGDSRPRVINLATPPLHRPEASLRKVLYAGRGFEFKITKNG